MRGLTLIV
jgi:hypothetical protein